MAIPSSISTADPPRGPPGGLGFASMEALHRRVRILGVMVDDLPYAVAVASLRAAMQAPTRRSLFFVNAHTLQLASKSDAFRRVLNEADLVLGDGTGVRWAARLNGVRLQANLNGTDLIPALMAAAEGDGRRCYLLGATPEIAARAAAILERSYPGWSIVGHHHGFLDDAETERIIATIETARPHLLLVGMGNPIQEHWIAAHRDRLSANLCVGVGGLFSYLTGDYRRAPPVMRRLGLEWVAVLLTQRRKWRRYVIGAPMFLIRVLGERLFGERAS